MSLQGLYVPLDYVHLIIGLVYWVYSEGENLSVTVICTYYLNWVCVFILLYFFVSVIFLVCIAGQ